MLEEKDFQAIGQLLDEKLKTQEEKITKKIDDLIFKLFSKLRYCLSRYSEP